MSLVKPPPVQILRMRLLLFKGRRPGSNTFIPSLSLYIALPPSAGLDACKSWDSRGCPEATGIPLSLIAPISLSVYWFWKYFIYSYFLSVLSVFVKWKTMFYSFSAFFYNVLEERKSLYSSTDGVFLFFWGLLDYRLLWSTVPFLPLNYQSVGNWSLVAPFWSFLTSSTNTTPHPICTFEYLDTTILICLYFMYQ